jgi:hypothetical protein
MSEFPGPFDPPLAPAFSTEAYRRARCYPQNGRSLFHALMQEREEPALFPLAYHFIERLLSRVSSEADSASSPFAWDSAGISQALQFRTSRRLLPATPIRGRLRDALIQVQPVILSEPCWLQNILQTSTNQAPAAIVLSAVYASSGAMATQDKPFHALLLNAGLETPDPGSFAFVQNETIDPLFFEFAALQLALAQFPRTYFPEILGFTVAWCESRALLDGLAADHPELTMYLRLRRHRLSSAKPLVIEAIRDYLARLEDGKATLWRRISTGFDLYREHFERCERRLRDRLETPETAAQAAAKLFTGKARAASGHHRHVKLAGRLLDDWFAEQPFDAGGFLAALRRSAYVDRENPAASPLLKLFEFDGPMFGVLTESDKNRLHRWLSEEDAGLQEAPCPDETPPETDWLPDAGGSDSPAFCQMGRRELYHYLVNAELYPDVLPAARRVAERVLRASRLFSRLPFENYTHRAFAAYIDTLYRREIKAYEPLEGKPRLSRQAYLWGIEQLAPAILADGCWLQHVNRLGFTAYAAIGASLAKIYDDETGNGIEARNHPVIYRHLLDSLHIDLPPIHDRAFCRHPGFIDSAFDIPVYLLAISQFPASFLPELLGLNMAIELSGLGRVYLRLAEELEYWGIDPKIVTVHISIDNAASGHAALAGNAIRDYLDRIAAGQGEAAQNAHWRRIYRGYCSLAAASRTFKMALAAIYLYRQLKGRSAGRSLFIRRSDQHD